jgi:uncharacterized protein YacL
VIGWILGWVISKVSKRVLDWINIDHYISHNGRSHFKLSKILPIIFSWFVYLVFIQAAVEALGIASLVAVVGLIVGFIPGLIGAILVIVAGYAIGEYVRRHVADSKVAYSDVIAKGLFFLILYISVATALPLVNIDATLINNILLVIVASAGAGMAIAVGLGMKDEVAKWARKHEREFMK